MNKIIVHRKFIILKFLIFSIIIALCLLVSYYDFINNGFLGGAVVTIGISFIIIFICIGSGIDLLVNYKVEIIKDELKVISYSFLGNKVVYNLLHDIQTVSQPKEDVCPVVNLKKGRNGLSLNAKSFTKRKEVENFITGLKLM